jgi:hypothetical protein
MSFSRHLSRCLCACAELRQQQGPPGARNG